jgi:hypothetical protein
MTTPLSSSCAIQDTKIRAYLKVYYNYLFNNVATNAMVSEAIGIKEKNLTRFKRELEKAGMLKSVRSGYCKVTRFRAAYLTTNPDNFPIDYQWKLFPEMEVGYGN